MLESKKMSGRLEVLGTALSAGGLLVGSEVLYFLSASAGGLFHLWLSPQRGHSGTSQCRLAVGESSVSPGTTS